MGRRATTVGLKALGAACAGLSLYQLFVSEFPSNHEYAVPGEAAMFALAAWVCLHLAYHRHPRHTMRQPLQDVEGETIIVLPPSPPVERPITPGPRTGHLADMTSGSD